MKFTHNHYPQVKNIKELNENVSAILLGKNSNSLDMLSSLRKKGVAVSIVYADIPFNNEFGKNNYQNDLVNEISIKLICYLNDMSQSNKRQVIISSDDMYTVLLAFAKESLVDDLIYQNLTTELVRKCSNKIEFDILCRKLNIDSPTTFVIDNKENLKKIKEHLIFPGIVKPQYPGAVSKKLIPKVLKINNFEELEALSE